MACDPNRVGEFQDSVGLTIEYATALGCKQVNCLAGIQPRSVSSQMAHETLVDNLRFAAPEMEKAGVRLLIEPINTMDIPGFVVNRTHQARSIIGEVGSGNLFLQHDIYHMQIMEGTWRGRSRRTWISSAICRLRTIRAGTSRGRARSTTRTCSR